MQAHPELSEPNSEACGVLVDVFNRLNDAALNPNDRDILRRYLRADLATKSARLHPDLQRNIWTRAQAAQVPDSVRRRIANSPLLGTDFTFPQEGRSEDSMDDPRGDKISADIFIVTVIEEEFEAVLRTFDIDPNSEPTYSLRGGKFFMASLIRPSRSDLVVYITMIGEARNVPCVNACRDIFERFSVGACILVGIAGGNIEKVKLGDVVAALQVFDIEGGKSVQRFKFLQGFLARPQTYDPPTEIKRFIQNLDPAKHEWTRRFKECLGQYKGRSLSKPIGQAAWDVVPSFHRADIVVGEKVLADGSLPRTARRLSDKVFAVEMEGSGFASACKHCSVPWLVIRGISDFGNPQKEDGWQVVAAIAAATITRLLLEKEYRLRQEELVL